MDDDLILVARIDEKRSICISSLSRQTYLDTDASVFGSDRGFFVFERDEGAGGGELAVLAKTASLEAAYRLAELLEQMIKPHASNAFFTRG
jgi:hypothetical protein